MYFVLVLVPLFQMASADLCPLTLSVNLTDMKRNSDGSITYDNLTFPLETQFTPEGGNEVRGCVCKVKNCMRKCCHFGESMVNETCEPTDDYSFKIHVYENEQPAEIEKDHFYYIQGSLCGVRGYYRLYPMLYQEDTFYLQKNGSIFLPFMNESYGETLTPDRFCVDLFVDEDEVNISALVCFHEDKKEVDPVYSFGMIISMPFLLLTFLVYAVLPDRNLHGKCLMCYVITLFCAYALLIFIQLYPIAIEAGACKTLGILCLFFFMVSFFWMNVMSIDICWTFSGMRGFSGSRKEAERKRFLVYCGYAWGMPFLLAMMVTGLSISADSDLNAWYNPGMGDGQCWFRDGIPTMLYFYLPMALLIIINLTLFCTTACKIKRVQQDTAMLRKDESNKQSYESDKQRFNLYLKLLLAMGVNWSMEIISWIVDWQIGQVPPPVWYITDFCNALYGVFIFFIFVFKQNIWKLLKRRYYMVIGKPSLARSMTQSAYSPRTTGSSLNHTVSNDKSYVNDSSVLTSEVA